MFWWQGDCWLSQPDLNQTSKCGLSGSVCAGCECRCCTSCSWFFIWSAACWASVALASSAACLSFSSRSASSFALFLSCSNSSALRVCSSSSASTHRLYTWVTDHLKLVRLQDQWGNTTEPNMTVKKLPLLVGTLKLRLVCKWMIFFSLAIHRAYTLLCGFMLIYTHRIRLMSFIKCFKSTARNLLNREYEQPNRGRQVY